MIISYFGRSSVWWKWRQCAYLRICNMLSSGTYFCLFVNQYYLDLAENIKKLENICEKQYLISHGVICASVSLVVPSLCFPIWHVDATLDQWNLRGSFCSVRCFYVRWTHDYEQMIARLTSESIRVLSFRNRISIL